MAVIVGIDPGVRPTLCRIDTANGAVEFCEETAVVIKKGKTKGKRTMPHPALIANILRRWAPDHCVIEEVNPVGKVAGRERSPMTGGMLMHARGICEGVTAALGIPCDLVTPSAWTRAMKVRVGSGPEGARQRALEINPSLAEALSRKGDHNRAASFLLAKWGGEFGTNPLL
jgi:Holliday junction resolvasome RuvABC endonuclease subunit